MKINNQIYDDQAAGWWDEHSFLYAMGVLLNPVRVPYFTQALTTSGMPRGSALLDVGCGGGSLAEAFACHGFEVSGVDLSAGSIEAAREHATCRGLNIRYSVASADDLPFEDESYDVVSCCELLEHVDRPGLVIQECSRVLRPGGIMLFATPNRTLLTWLVLVKLVQDWPVTSVSPPDMHHYDKFIRPVELDWLFEQAGIKRLDITGVFPRIPGSPYRLLLLPALRVKAISHSEAAQHIRLQQSRITALAYMGIARKTSWPEKLD